MQPTPAAAAKIKDLALAHGIVIPGDLDVNDLGLDFQVVTAEDDAGTLWVLRIPRRADVAPKIEQEARILRFVKTRLPVAVPDWQVVTSELVAYPKLTDTTALTMDLSTGALTWHVDQTSTVFAGTLATSVAALHAVPVGEAVAAAFRSSTPEQVRDAFAEDLDLVKRELGIGHELERRLRTWLDNASLWPDFSVLIHGDLYAGHILVDGEERVSGIIDWTEAEVSDPALDFSGHFIGFGEQGLRQLIDAYAEAGGRTWPTMFEHVKERSASSPIKYGTYALQIGDERHLAAARVQLGVA